MFSWIASHEIPCLAFRAADIVIQPVVGKTNMAGAFLGTRKRMQSRKRQIVACDRLWRRAVTSGTDDRLTHNFRSKARGSIDQTLWNSEKPVRTFRRYSSAPRSAEILHSSVGNDERFF